MTAIQGRSTSLHPRTNQVVFGGGYSVRRHALCAPLLAVWMILQRF
ncbi:MAG: hypothetical protein KBC57_10525 [Neisseriaceae bacterium]|nr:hypothetical protein [Neisseriaceae bacterium]MBP6862772.1 hypothetical protein [Neisseriaceae bacterium]